MDIKKIGIYRQEKFLYSNKKPYFSQMKKIFFLNSTLNVGGSERMLYEMIMKLDKNRFEIQVLCLYKPGFFGEKLISDGINLMHSFMRNKFDLIGACRLLSFLKKNNPDLLWIMHSPLTLFLGFLFGRIAKIPFLLTIVQGMRRETRWNNFKSWIIDKQILRRLDMVAVVSKAKFNSLQRGYNLEVRKLMLIHNTVDVNMFVNLKRKDVARSEIGISEDERIVGIVGRLVREKGYDIFLKAARKISDNVDRTKFLIIGNGKEMENLKRLSRKLGMEGRVIFLGERHNIPDLVQLFDVAVLSSRVESCSLALLEYMAASRPIVATDAGGNPEVIIDGQSGLIISANDPEALAMAVIELLKNCTRAEAMGNAAKKRVESEFSTDAMVKRIENIFTDFEYANKRLCYGKK